jgi:lysophospholipase L1-like esterase
LAKDKQAKPKSSRKNATVKDEASFGDKKSKHPFWFNLVLLIIPIIFFILLELVLRVSNYGIDTTEWVEIAPGQLVLNPDVGYRYFHSTAGIPYSNQNSFSKVKNENTFRVFIMGASSAAGYPFTPNGDFGLYIKKKLQILYPKQDIEIVNVSLTATNSYTIRDLLPGVIEQKPDLILFYAGHNEYYGAFGVGSMESIGQSRKIVNFLLSLEKFKTFVFLRDILKWTQNIITGEGTDGALKKSGTLMSRMVKDQTIAFNSDVYNLGIEQFRGNFTDILTECNENNIPVIISTLACNLKDQPPFVSLNDRNIPRADEIFKLAESKLEDTTEALRLFRYAKDLDGLRFRASEKINEIIIDFSKKFNYPIVKIDSIFNSVSPKGITGNNLMTDHLHPTFDGYKLIGKSFFDEMVKNNFLPKAEKQLMDPYKLDSLANAQTYISRLDSTISKFRILVLKNDWPFSEPKSVTYMLKLFNQQTLIDSLAVKVIDNRYSWERAHREAAEYYLRNNNYDEFIRELTILITQYPFVSDYYKYASEQLLAVKMFDDAYPFLLKGQKRFPGAFYAKWIGIIDLSKENIDSAIKFLNESLQYGTRDSQVYYNLSGAYSKKKMFTEALTTIESCLSLNPNYPGASGIKSQLLQILRSK